MRNLIRYTGLLTKTCLLAGLTLVSISCSQQEKDLVKPTTSSTSEELAKADKTTTFYGPAVPLGKGVARAWVMVDVNKQPISIGVDLSAKAVLDMGHEPVEYTLQLPKQVAVPPYDHIDFGWNPEGHEPEEFYGVPHFDMHFYMITEALQATIPFLAPPAFDLAPATKYLPAGYVLGPGLVPNMGAHWVDVLSAEFNGGKFTKTFIYGSYNGNVTFLEPMFTLAYLQNLAALGTSTPIRQPAAYQRAGYYPTSYTISYDSSPKSYRISLNNLVYRPAS
ncbi:hypothetical protein AAE02nite_32930 [Adhaeribacter aerolatus]|uniref:DUF5602 domain-containing protein n=1 Tax=Adhaeribacter aerolatus TaxID=670289 RepID=A0A512B102_9BACT|nr:hypothetical protein [Adhaeribacter aerolatus]GEO05629.1 hypothetical protein AAE02nite_32930 [Adhaeribacter aerolatus]